MQVFLGFIRILAVIIIGIFIGITLSSMSTLGGKLKELETENNKLGNEYINAKIALLDIRNKVLQIESTKDEKARQMAFENLVRDINKGIQDELYNQKKALAEMKSSEE